MAFSSRMVMYRYRYGILKLASEFHHLLSVCSKKFVSTRRMYLQNKYLPFFNIKNVLVSLVQIDGFCFRLFFLKKHHKWIYQSSDVYTFSCDAVIQSQLMLCFYGPATLVQQPRYYLCASQKLLSRQDEDGIDSENGC